MSGEAADAVEAPAGTSRTEGTARRAPERRPSRPQRPFLVLWTVAVTATVAAFVLHLALRGRTVDLGYKLGRARAEQARLREVKRVLSLEAASYETPQRVELVARTLLGMSPPPPERVVPLRAPVPTPAPEDERPPKSEPVVPPPASAAAGAALDAASAAPSAGQPPSAEVSP